MKTQSIGTGGWGFREQPLEQQLRAARELKLATVELGIGEAKPVSAVPLTADQPALDLIRAQFRAAGVPLTHAFTGNDFTQEDPNACQAHVDRLARVIDLAAGLGVSFIRIFAGFSPAEKVVGRRWDVLLECLAQSAAHAKRHGITLAIETHGYLKRPPGGVVHCHTVSTEPCSLLRLCREMPTELAINFDPANLRAAGVIWPHELVPLIASRIRYVHLKDFAHVNAAENIVRPVACGEGLLEWEPLLRSLAFYKGTLLIEYEPVEDIVDGTRRSLAFLERLL